MTKEEFFRMNVGDKFYIECDVCQVIAKKETIKNLELSYTHNGKSYCIKNTDNFDWFTCIKKISKLSPVERVDKKIFELKAELEKWEAEKKSLEIQPGKFYEIEYKKGCLNKIDVFYVEAIRHGGDVVYVKTTRTYEYLDKIEIKSFKQITDISVLEKAWDNG